MPVARGDFREALQMIGQIAHKKQNAQMTLNFVNGQLHSWVAEGEEYIVDVKKLKLDKPIRRRRKATGRGRKK